MPQILNQQRAVAVPMKELEVFAGRVARKLRLNKESFAVCLVSDAAIARMNRQYRGKRGSTDVLSFPASAAQNGSRSSRGAEGFLGDIAIAPATARRNARQLGRALDDELRVLILHGVLHLMGYDHETDDGQMERREMRLRRQLGIA